MATRSTISVVTKEGKVQQIYCHWDGYLSYNGRILKEFYNTLDKALELVSFGDMSSLREKCIPDPEYSHTFDQPQQDVSVYYGRDRQESNVDAEVYSNIGEYCEKLPREEYDYLFYEGKWYLVDDKSVIELTDELLEDEDFDYVEKILSNAERKLLY